MEAMQSYDAISWKKAMEEEIENLNPMSTWKLVKIPKNKDIIDVK